MAKYKKQKLVAKTDTTFNVFPRGQNESFYKYDDRDLQNCRTKYFSAIICEYQVQVLISNLSLKTHRMKFPIFPLILFGKFIFKVLFAWLTYFTTLKISGLNANQMIDLILHINNEHCKKISNFWDKFIFWDNFSTLHSCLASCQNV